MADARRPSGVSNSDRFEALAGRYFSGSDRAYVVPSWTHFPSSCLVRRYCGAHAQPTGHRTAAHHRHFGGRGIHDRVRLRGIDPDEHSALSARSDGHVAADEEGGPTEHRLLGQIALRTDQGADAVSQVLVVHGRDGTGGRGLHGGLGTSRLGCARYGGNEGARMGTAPQERIRSCSTRRWRPAAMLMAVAAMVAAPAILVATSAGASAAPYRVTLPDLQILVPTDLISIGPNSDTGDRQLQFTHITWDAGTGPFQIKPKYDRRTGMSTFVQTIYKSRNGRTWRPDYTVRLAATGVFDPPSDYRYPLTRFTLNTMNQDGSPGAVVAVSPKSDYCITADTLVGGVPNTPNKTSPPQRNCTNPNKPLGLSVGWGDEYDQTDNGQPIDLTGVPDGDYVLQATVDPDHLFTESDKHNNVVDTDLDITGDTRPGAQPDDAVHRGAGDRVVGPRPGVEGLGVGGPAGTGQGRCHRPRSPLCSSSSTASRWARPSPPPPTPTRGRSGARRRGATCSVPAPRTPRATWPRLPVKTVDVVGSTPARLLAANDPPPDVAVLNPVANQQVSGTVPVAATAHDNVAVKSVQFMVDGRPLGAPATVAPYAVQWNTRTVSQGTHTLSAVATNVNGEQATAANVEVTVKNPAPPMTCFVLQVHVSAGGRGTVTSPSFHTAAADETLLAFVAGHGPWGAEQADGHRLRCRAHLEVGETGRRGVW